MSGQRGEPSEFKMLSLSGNPPIGAGGDDVCRAAEWLKATDAKDCTKGEISDKELCNGSLSAGGYSGREG